MAAGATCQTNGWRRPGDTFDGANLRAATHLIYFIAAHPSSSAPTGARHARIQPTHSPRGLMR